MFIKEIDKNGMVARQGELKSGDIILKVRNETLFIKNTTIINI